MTDGAPRRRRAVVLVGGPAAPYSRAIRIARALAAEGFDVEIAAIAAPGLPEREPVAPARPDGRRARAGSVGGRPIEIRRYRPSGPWAILGASEAATAARGVAPRRGDAARDRIAVAGPAARAAHDRRAHPRAPALALLAARGPRLVGDARRRSCRPPTSTTPAAR